MRYDELFSPKVTPGTAPGVAYDAFYVLAYAAYAAGDEPITGANLARGIARLVPPGAPIDVGPTHVFDAVAELRAGRNVDLKGAATRLDFDLATGETAADFAVYCLKTDEGGAAFDVMESGLVFHPGGTQLDGTMKCR
jgi:branched-chain amino acid transport system substrate-binding protein